MSSSQIDALSDIFEAQRAEKLKSCKSDDMGDS